MIPLPENAEVYDAFHFETAHQQVWQYVGLISSRLSEVRAIEGLWADLFLVSKRYCLSQLLWVGPSSGFTHQLLFLFLGQNIWQKQLRERFIQLMITESLGRHSSKVIAAGQN